MRICLRAAAKFCTAALARSCVTSSPPSPQPNQSCLRIISRRRDDGSRYRMVGQSGTALDGAICAC